MRILINDENIDFTLEAEKNLGDIIRSLEQWLASQKMVIVGLSVDQKEYRQQDLDEKKSTPLDELKEISITASDFLNLERNGLKSLTSFFQALPEALAAGDEKRLAGVLGRYAEVEAMLRFVFSATGNDVRALRRMELSTLLQGATPGMVMLWDKDAKGKASALCEFFLKELADAAESYAQIELSSRSLTKETLVKLRGAAGQLSEVSILLQTGKDSQAMRTIASFTEMAQLFLKLISELFSPEAVANILVEGLTLATYSQALNGHLRELVEAFERKDYILIGDLCEYEIAPKIIALIETVEQALSA